MGEHQARAGSVALDALGLVGVRALAPWSGASRTWRLEFPPGGEWVLVGSAVFKTVVGREERPGCVRFARASANCH